MMRGSRLQLLSIVLAALAGAAAPAPNARADSQIDLRVIRYAHSSHGPLVVMDVHDAPIRLVLEKLFDGAGVNYEIEPNLTGTITLRLRYASFTAALHAILRASTPRVTYDLTRGVYHFKRRREPSQ